MCGFTGLLTSSPLNSIDSILTTMSREINHRGPDSHGVWRDVDNGIFLAHQRLSIVDLTVTGHQPMLSKSGRYVIVFNGEIYNHLKIRKELEKSKLALAWIGESDTESLLVGIDIWGIKKTLEYSIGAFSFALWDKKKHTLTLARDRLGEKPLYYGWQGDVFIFGSELKALKAHPSFKGEIDRNSLCLYMRHNCVPAPYSIYKGIYKLQPGKILEVSLSEPRPKVETYWSGTEVARDGTQFPFNGSPDDAINELELLLKDAISQQMIADVPLGAFLSGGIDSSIIVSLMQKQSTSPVKTFSIGFNEENYNEAKQAKLIARHLGTDHTELYVSPEDCLAVIPKLPSLYDEPFADSSQIPTFLVSELAKQHVTVALSGDGGDELFAGYNRYAITAKTWGKLSRVPYSLRQLAATSITSFSPSSWDRINKVLQSILPFYHKGGIGSKLHKGARVMTAKNARDLYKGMVSHWQHPENIVLHSKEPTSLITDYKAKGDGLSDVERMMLLDMLTYLSDDILCKVDRAAMGVSLETRIPFLDHRVVEFAWQLPLKYKLRENQTKWVLRQVLYKHVPKKLIDRPKMGFGVPIDSWLRGPLREWAENLLDENSLIQSGYFNPSPIRNKWKEHLSGRRNWQYHLWDVLMFCAWLEENEHE